MSRKRDLLDLLVPPAAREDPRRLLRYRGIARSLLSISGVVAVLFVIYAAVRPEFRPQEAMLFGSAVLMPILGAVFVRVTNRLELGLLLTNAAGIAIVASWCALTGGITSVALPWFLPNLFLLSTFGSRRMLVATAGLLLAVLALLLVASLRGWLPANQIPTTLGPAFSFLSLGSSVAVVVVAGLAATGARERSKQLLLEAKCAAEAASRAKSAFLASMSHELRTPLNAVLMSADLLKEDPEEPLSARQEHLVDQLRLGGDLVLGLINQVLELSSIEAGKLSLTLVDTPLAEAVPSALSVILPLAGRRHIRVEFSLEALSDLRVLADPLHLRSVLINLLSNAVKYNRPEGKVLLEARRVAGGRVRIDIHDTGTGIPEQQREAAFQPFNRLGAEGSHIEGTGLGLSITEHLVRMMAGSLGFESVPGQGTTFWVELPEVPAGPPEPSSVAAVSESEGEGPRTSGPAMSVLVVEDHPINQQLMRLSLEREGHRVVVASDGAEALHALGDLGKAKAPFDLVLMDLLMPVMDGLEATRRIREMEVGTGRRLPIVAVTACALDKDRLACLEAGMDDYLTKPVAFGQLLQIMARLTGGQD